MPVPRAVLAALCAAIVAAILASPALADPTYESTFSCSALTPCGAFTSITATHVSVDEDTGNVYAIDAAHDVVDVFDATGAYLSQIPGSLTDARSFGFGGFDDIAVDNSSGVNRGNVYINSENAGKVFAFTSSGTFLWESSAGVSDVCGVGVDNSGNPWIGDYNNGLQQLDPADGSTVGSPMLTANTPCEFAFDSSGNVVVALFGNTIVKYDASGNTIVSLLPGFGYAEVAVDDTDAIWAPLGTLYAWDSTGSALQGSPYAGQSGGAVSLVVNRPTKTLYVAASAGIEIYTLVRSFTLSVAVVGPGRVDGAPGAISGCTSSGGVCSDTFPDGTDVRLTATPDAGARIGGWTGCDSNQSADTCLVRVGADSEVTATFEVIPRHRVSVVKEGTGSGTVTSSPAGIACGSTCDALFDDSAVVTMSARADPGSTFTGWTDGTCAASRTRGCLFAVSVDTTLRASFAQSPPVVVTGAASGVNETAATVAGTVNPNSATVTDCHIEYGTSTAYGSQAACSPSPGGGGSAVPVTAALTGLSPGAAYHYRVVATNRGGSAAGADAVFATSAVVIRPPPPPSCLTDPSLCTATLTLTTHRATVNGSAAILTVSCTGDLGGTCRDALTFRAAVKHKVKRGRKTVVKKNTITVGSASIVLAVGNHGRLRIRLTSAAMRALKTTKLTATAAGLPGSITIPKAPPKRRRRR